MLKELRKKLYIFWDEHKWQIIGYGLFAVTTVATGIAVNNYSEKKEAEKAARFAEAQEAWDKAKEDLAKQREEAEAQEKAIEEDPANQLTCGGYIRPDNDWLYETDDPYVLANCVPISAMGEFGQNIISRMKKSLPGKEDGYFNIDTAIADVTLDFGHQVWLNQHQESA